MTVQNQASHSDDASKVSTRSRFVLTCIILLLLGLGVRLTVWHFNREAIAPVMSGLTAGYKDDARTLARGDLGLFLRGPNPPSDATVLAHPPGYAVLLALIFSVFGESDFAVRFLQIFCDSISAVLVFLIALELLSKRVATIAGVLAALSPQLAYNSLLLLPDSLAVLPILLAVLLFARARGRSRAWIGIVASGALLGLSCWLRPNGLLLPLFVAALIPILFERGKRLPMSVALIAAAVIVIAPLTIRNYAVFKQFIPISLGSGVTFVEGIADYDTSNTMALPRTDVELVQEESRRFNRPEYNGSLFNPDGIQRERDRVARGIDAIRSHPFWFMGVMIQRSASMLRWERVPANSGSPLVLETQPLTLPTRTVGVMLLRFPAMILKSVQKFFITAIMLPLVLFGLLVLLKRRQLMVIGLVCIVPAYFICIQSLLHTEYRYVLAMNYFLVILVAVSADSIVNAPKQRLRKI
jgi:4-amino-4-deoxy-L-arabinose transferase-like glycosyltransferase